MYTIQERVRIVILMAKYESVTAVKRQLTKEGFQHKPTDQTIRLLYKKFLETGSVEFSLSSKIATTFCAFSGFTNEFGLPDRTLSSITIPTRSCIVYISSGPEPIKQNGIIKMEVKLKTRWKN